MAFVPKITNSFDHRAKPLMSISQYRNARKQRAMPVVKTTYELVQRFLLMGNQRSQMSPAIKSVMPKTKRPKIGFDDEFSPSSLVTRPLANLWSHVPVKTPAIVEAI